MNLIKQISVLLAGAVMFGSLPISVPHRQEFGRLTANAATENWCGPNLKWSYDSGTKTLTINGTGEMYRYNNYSSLPPWSDYRGEIQSVIVQEGVTSLSAYAFYQIPNSGNKDNLTYVSLPSTLTSIGQSAFYNCLALKQIIIPDSITRIENYTFQKCKSLTSVYIGKSVKEIGFSAFEDCVSLSAVTIPDGTSYISQYAFSGCTALINTTIPANVTSMGDWVFQNCNNLTIYGYSGTKAEDYANYYHIPFIPLGESVGTTQTMPTTTYITTTSTIMTSVTTETTTTSMPTSGSCGENLTWYYHASSKTLTISGNGDMDNWTDIVYYFGDGGCECPPWNLYDIENVVIEDGVTSIGSSAFYYHTNLKNVKIANSVKYIGNSAFYETEWLKARKAENPLVIVNGILIDGRSYQGDLIVPDSVTSISGGAFGDNDKLTSLIIPDSVTELGSTVCYQCTNLKRVEIGNKVPQLNYAAFFGCKSLEQILIGNNVKVIDSMVFNNCTALKEITLPSSLKDTYGYAFSNCPNLTKLTVLSSNLRLLDTFSDSVNLVIYGYSGSMAESFARENSIPFVIIQKPNVTRIWGENITWTWNPNTYTLSINGKGDIMESEYFSQVYVPWNTYRDSAQTVILEDGINNLPCYAFYYFSKIKSISIPESVTRIESNAFENCENLVSVSIPDRVTSIGSEAFINCKKLTNLTIPKSVTEIGIMAFSSCGDGFTISGYTGSYAEQYAIENSIPFISIGNAFSAITSGDINQDQQSTLSDAVLLCRFVLEDSTLDTAQFDFNAGDFDHDSIITILDVASLLSIISFDESD